MRPTDGRWAVCFLNRGTSVPESLSVSLKKLGLPVDKELGFDALDLFTGEYIGFMDSYSLFNSTVPPSGVRFYLFGPAETNVQ